MLSNSNRITTASEQPNNEQRTTKPTPSTSPARHRRARMAEFAGRTVCPTSASAPKVSASY